jgi:hypothetical protein
MFKHMVAHGTQLKLSKGKNVERNKFLKMASGTTYPPKFWKFPEVLKVKMPSELPSGKYRAKIFFLQ